MPITSLRNQIIESQKIRSDLMKWKLVLVSGIGSVGLGIAVQGASPHHLILALIPLVCVYVDALCAHLSLRIRAIGVFMTIHPTEDPAGIYIQSYERFIRGWTDERWLKNPDKGSSSQGSGGDGRAKGSGMHANRGERRLEEIALRGSTLLLSLGIGAYGGISMREVSNPFLSVEAFTPVGLFASGVVGLLTTVLIGCFYDDRVAVIRQAAKEYIRNPATKTAPENPIDP